MASRQIIGDAFKDAVIDIDQGLHTEYWFKGGRGSLKSSFISIIICLGILEDPNANAVIYRKVGNTIRDSVFAQMIWAIDLLGCSELFRVKMSPCEIVHKRTGQRVLFRGADDPMKSKSIKLSKGYFKYLWFEELAEFRSMEDVRVIIQSIVRGTRKACILYSYNPPRSAQSWVNKEALENNPYRYVHTSSYLDAPEEWLGEAFIQQAEILRKTNERAYRNEYLGEVTGNGGAVFENLEVRPITDEDINSLEYYYQGIDWGYFPDPFQWVRCAYDPKRRVLYIIDEYRVNKAGNKETYDQLKDKLDKNESLTADSAEPKSIGDWREFGAWWIRGVVKGPGSVAYSTKWLAALSKIVIDPKCSKSVQEFTLYEFEQNSYGEFVNSYPDHDNHCIDAVRYAMFPAWRLRGN